MNIKVLIILGVAIVIILALIAGIILFIKNSNSKYEVIDEDIVTKEKKEKVKKVKKETTFNLKKRKEKDEEKIENNGDLINYNVYHMSKKEKLIYGGAGIIVMFTCAYIFYESIILSGIFSLSGIYYIKIKNKSIIKDRKDVLLSQFKEAMYSISSSLSAGKAAETAFKDAYEDLQLIYLSNKDAYILDELLYINRKIQMNETIEDALKNFAARSGLEDIETFSDIFCECTRAGGNLRKVLQNSSRMIGDKIDIKQEIKTLISAKKFEATVLTFIPFGIVLFMKYTAPEFLNPLFTLPGRFVASFGLALIGVGVLMARKITDIEV
ncbi:MAG: type II secretion system F family protein [Clostridium chrysemydis]|uniref:type II secretion system F family protein n=1 Tax=Clostridium TaxID=1485 RepID=UPI0021535321|nr:type II secretion system F family protein [Clostridium sp. LY3-2]MCR6515219.1 type II secretion system F family protein [Clostridium sp. LY3-2]